MKTAFVVIHIIVLQIFLFAQNTDQNEKLELKVDSLSQVVSKLSAEVEKFKQQKAEEELEALRKSAQTELQVSPKEEELTKKSFHEGSRSMQALNPEISVATDMVSNYKTESPHFSDESRSGFQMRVVELMIQSNLDPFSFTKIILEAGGEGVEMAEAYVTWVNLFKRLNLTAGKFRQQFGVINRWHEHALDQTFFPLPIEMYMGEEGLNQIGISMNWLMPSLTASANELTLQITNSQNETLFSGEEFSLPCGLIHFKNFYDISPSSYFELGISGLAGTNDSTGFSFSNKHTWTYLGGVDLTYSWEPVNRAHYRGVTWRSELFYLSREMAGTSRIKALGGYSYLEYKLSSRFIIGARFDIAQPPELDNDNMFLWQTIPYITFWQSEFAYLRLQWNHRQGKNIAEKDNRIYFQIDWAIGPHKHEKY
jgi:hypothetical protein